MIAAQEAETTRAASLANHYEHCGTLVHEHDRDRWLASLFAPADKRPHLHALYAFNIEIARIRDVVSDPMPGEIRLQWWTEALEDAARGDVQAHPVADAFLDTIAKFGLSRADFSTLIEARRVDLYDDPMPDMRALLAYCDATAACPSGRPRKSSPASPPGRQRMPPVSPGGSPVCCGHCRSTQHAGNAFCPPISWRDTEPRAPM